MVKENTKPTSNYLILKLNNTYESINKYKEIIY